MGLLDNFSEFVKTPEGQGVLAAAFGGLATARRGTPINNIGKAGMAGLLGYSNAQDRAQQAKEAEFAQQYRQAQLEEMRKKQSAPQYEKVGNTLLKFGPDGTPVPVYQAPAEEKKSQLDQMLDAAGITDPSVRRKYAMQGLQKSVTHAPPPSAVINMKQETEEAKTVGKSFGEAYSEIMKTDMAAPGKIARFDRLGQLLEGVNTGKLTPMGTEIAAFAKSLGVDIDSKLGNKQAANSLSNELALQLRNPSGGAGMPGALSDKDREFLVNTTPGLGKDPAGNRLIIDTAKKLAQRDRDVARIARNYRKKNGSLDEGFFDELSSFADANPLFSSGSSGTPSPPSVGEVRNGYRFKGGNPADKSSWVKI